MRLRLLLPLLALLAVLIPVAGAAAADSHAPKGARLDWLPTDAWVMSAWLPFDEARLDAGGHNNHDELVTWLGDPRSRAQLPRRHGVAGTTAQLAHRLVAPRLAHVR